MSNQNVTVNRKYKDSVFRNLFGKNKKNALSLYNAVNNSSYTNEDDLEFTILEDVIYLKMKNDVSFLLGTSLSLYEHQSSYNPNMPLRGLLYFADLYKSMIKENERIYSKYLVRIPNPKYIVFYNGSEKSMEGDTKKLRLSDSFQSPDDSGEFEWTATKAVDDCIKNNILKEFLVQEKREGINVVLTEFDEEKFEAMLREEGRQEGLKEGLKEGELLQLCKLVSKKIVSLDSALQECNLPKEAFIEKMRQFGLQMQ